MEFSINGQKYSEFSELRESDKLLKHELKVNKVNLKILSHLFLAGAVVG